jgi:hypothetical protein
MTIRGEAPVGGGSNALVSLGLGCGALGLLAVVGAGAYWLTVPIRSGPPASSPVPPPAPVPVSVPVPAPVPAPEVPPAPSTATAPDESTLADLDPLTPPSSAHPAVPQIRVDDTAIDVAGLSPQIIRRIVLQHRAAVARCYEDALARTPTLGPTRVTAHFAILPDGTASEVTVDGSDDTILTTCMAAEIRRWIFPEPAGGGTVRVNYPFVLQPAE